MCVLFVPHDFLGVVVAAVSWLKSTYFMDFHGRLDCNLFRPIAREYFILKGKGRQEVGYPAKNSYTNISDQK